MDVLRHHGAAGGVPLLLRQKGRAAVHAAVFSGYGMHGAVGVLFHGCLRHADEGCGGGIRLEAASAAAGARLPVCHDDHVPQLAGGAGIAREQFAVQHHAAAHASAQRDHHSALGALGAARLYLRQRGGIGVIHQTDGKARLLPQGGADVIVHPAQVAGVDHRAAGIVHRAGAAHTHAAYLPTRRQIVYHVRYGLRYRRRARLGAGGAGALPEDLSGFADHGAFYVGAA